MELVIPTCLPAAAPLRKSHPSRPTIIMSTSSPPNPPHHKEKLLVILGTTGVGKSKLSIDIATHFPSSEIINSDKIQVYSGLDITANKIPVPNRRYVPHHLLGCFSDDTVDYTPSMFRTEASSALSAVHSRNGLPILVGGSTSFVHALVSSEEMYKEEDAGVTAGPCLSGELRYDCCFLWVDVSMDVLEQYLDRRVDEMLEQGMMEELRQYYKEGRKEYEYKMGLGRTIGVKEFDKYFESGKKRDYEEAVKEVKENTRRLAKKQLGKIVRMRDCGGLEIRRLDATASVRELLMRTSEWKGLWQRDVLFPSLDIVTKFLHPH